MYVLSSLLSPSLLHLFAEKCNGGPVTSEHLELQLIASKGDIENPPSVPSRLAAI